MRWFCWHDWTKWTASATSSDNIHFQLRKCVKCGMTKLREVELY